MKNQFHNQKKQNKLLSDLLPPYPVFKVLSSEKVSFLIHFVINKIILDKLIYLCYNVFKIRGQGTENKAGSDRYENGSFNRTKKN